MRIPSALLVDVKNIAKDYEWSVYQAHAQEKPAVCGLIFVRGARFAFLDTTESGEIGSVEHREMIDKFSACYDILAGGDPTGDPIRWIKKMLA